MENPLDAEGNMMMILIISMVLLWLVTLALVLVQFGLLRNQALLTWRLEKLEATMPRHVGRSGLRIGASLPHFSAKDTKGNVFSQSDLAGKRTLLAFTQPGCGPCATVVPALNEVLRKREIRVLGVSAGNPEATRAWAEEHAAEFPVLCQEDLSLSRRFEIFATPFAFLIDERGVIINKGVINNAQHIRFLLQRVPRSKDASAEYVAPSSAGAANDRSG